MSLGAALRAGRRDLGLSQRALAERAGLSKSVLARLELDGRSATLAQAEAALHALGMGLCVVDRDHSTAHLYPREVSLPEPGWRYFRREMRALRQGRQSLPAPVDRPTYMYPHTKRFWDLLLGQDPDVSDRR